MRPIDIDETEFPAELHEHLTLFERELRETHQKAARAEGAAEDAMNTAKQMGAGPLTLRGFNDMHRRAGEVTAYIERLHNDFGVVVGSTPAGRR